MDDPIIDLQSDHYFLSEVLRHAALVRHQNGLLTVQIASGIVTP